MVAPGPGLCMAKGLELGAWSVRVLLQKIPGYVSRYSSPFIKQVAVNFRFRDLAVYTLPRGDRLYYE